MTDLATKISLCHKTHDYKLIGHNTTWNDAQFTRQCAILEKDWLSYNELLTLWHRTVTIVHYFDVISIISVADVTHTSMTSLLSNAFFCLNHSVTIHHAIITPSDIRQTDILDSDTNCNQEFLSPILNSMTCNNLNWCCYSLQAP